MERQIKERLQSSHDEHSSEPSSHHPVHPATPALRRQELHQGLLATNPCGLLLVQKKKRTWWRVMEEIPDIILGL